VPDSTPTHFDLIVIGAGPGGYVAAIRAAQLGLNVACIDKESKFGGTCLRVGCIPSKALLDASEKFALAKTHFADVGIAFDNVRMDVATLMKRKDKVVDTLTGGVAGLLKKNKVAKIDGFAAFTSPNEIEVTNGQSKIRYTAAKFLIATGSAPIDLPFMPVNGKTIVHSDQAIALPTVPGNLVVVGAGAIGLELGSVWARLGAKVTVLEMLPVSIGATADEECARGLEKVLKKQGLEFFFGAKVTGVRDVAGKQHVVFTYEDKEQLLPADVVLVSVGRRAYADNLKAKEIGVAFDQRGRITIDQHFQTNLPHIYAIGDVVAGPMLAHKAEEEGIACVENFAGKHGHVNYNVIPSVVYTSPELAWVGQTEEQLKAAGTAYKVGKFNFRANGRALCMDEPEGFVKILADAETDRVLGVHILGAQASTMISEGASTMEFGGSSEDIARTCHAHPTLPEAVKEAAMAVEKRAIHS
jgi:dihydrolipoamide dehydrogenase